MKNVKQKRFFYLPNTSFYAFSMYARSMKDAREQIRTMLERKTLHGVQVWRG